MGVDLRAAVWEWNGNVKLGDHDDSLNWEDVLMKDATLKLFTSREGIR